MLTPDDATLTIAAELRVTRVLPTVAIADPADAVPLATALADGGLRVVEVSVHAKRSMDVLRRIRDERPDLLVGAGTVLTPDEVWAAVDAGARFIRNPGFGVAVVDHCLDHGVPVFPGVATATEIEGALARGVRTVGFFPAATLGGVRHLEAMGAPYPLIEWLPAGGIDETNLGAFLAVPRVIACAGDWMAPPAWIAAKAFDRVRAASEAAVRVARGAEGDVVAAAAAARRRPRLD